MLIKDIVIINGEKRYKTFSNENKYIRKVGTNEVYSEAIDIEGAPYEYEETDELIEEIVLNEGDY